MTKFFMIVTVFGMALFAIMSIAYLIAQNSIQFQISVLELGFSAIVFALLFIIRKLRLD